MLSALIGVLEDTEMMSVSSAEVHAEASQWRFDLENCVAN